MRCGARRGDRVTSDECASPLVTLWRCGESPPSARQSMAGACTMLLRVMVARVWGYRLGPPAPRKRRAVQGRPLRVRASGLGTAQYWFAFFLFCLDRGHVVTVSGQAGQAERRSRLSRFWKLDLELDLPEPARCHVRAQPFRISIWYTALQNQKDQTYFIGYTYNWPPPDTRHHNTVCAYAR